MKYFQSFLHGFLQRLVWLLLRTLILTWKIERRNMDSTKRALPLNPNKSYLFAVWHEQMISFLTCHAWTEPFLAMASKSKDGDFAAYIVQKMGFIPVRGSSRKKNVDKGGKEAMAEYVDRLNQGYRGGITVDGPRGPRHVVKPGIIMIAMEAGAPVIPAAGLCSSYWEFNSWDKFKIPKPFATLYLIYGEPIEVPKGSSQTKIQELCLQVANEMKAIEESFIVEMGQKL